MDSSVSEARGLRDALESSQQENKGLRGLVAELSAFKPEELHAEIDRLEHDNTVLRQRLERADKVRVTWDARLQSLRRELAIARREQDRLRSLLETERLAKR